MGMGKPISRKFSSEAGSWPAEEQVWPVVSGDTNQRPRGESVNQPQLIQGLKSLGPHCSAQMGCTEAGRRTRDSVEHCGLIWPQSKNWVEPVVDDQLNDPWDHLREVLWQRGKDIFCCEGKVFILAWRLTNFTSGEAVLLLWPCFPDV